MDHIISSTQEIQDGKVSQIEQLSCVGHSLKAKMIFYIQLLINHKPCTIIHMCKCLSIVGVFSFAKSK
jgi:predicted lipase